MLCVCIHCKHVCVPACGYSCVRVSVCMWGGLCAGHSWPPTLTPTKPREGQQRWRRLRLRRGDPPPCLPRPHPRPLPAGRFADRPNRQKLRARGPLGAFLLWCELPMAGAGAGEESLAQPNHPGRRARSLGREAETHGRPPQAPPAPDRPRLLALQPMAGPGAGPAEGRGLARVP